MAGIHICITVDWEGEDLSYVKDLQQVRKRTGEKIPFTHFICPNYYAVGAEDSKQTEKILHGIETRDEVGLHIHCYKSLIRNAVGIPFRTTQNYHNVPTWYEDILGELFPFLKKKVSGRGVPLSVYDPDEIRRIIEVSRNLLIQNLGLSEIKGFRAGGWIANDTVMNIVSELGFQYDSSAVPPEILSDGFSIEKSGNRKDDYGDKNGVFTEHIIKLWGYETQENGFLKNKKSRSCNHEKAIQIGNQPFAYDGLIEIPNNVGLTDFSSPSKTVIPYIKKCLNELEQNPNQDFVVVYGCHLEGDPYYKAILVEFVDEVLAQKFYK